MSTSIIGYANTATYPATNISGALSVSTITPTHITNGTSSIEQNTAPHFQKIPNLIFKLFTAENGHILEVTNKIPDPASLYMGTRFDNSSKVYILNSSETLGDKIAQILSVYLLEK